MSMILTIQKYLEEQCKVDAYLAEKYKDTMLKGCVEYINEMARKELESKSGFLENEVVYHWAREYFVDGLAEKEYEKKVDKKLEELSDLSKVKINNDIPEERQEQLRKVIAKARAMKQQEFDF